MLYLPPPPSPSLPYPLFFPQSFLQSSVVEALGANSSQRKRSCERSEEETKASIDVGGGARGDNGPKISDDARM